MAHVLVVYATTEGQSRKTARHIAERVEALGHSDELADAADGNLPDDLSAYDAVFLVASVHHGRYQAPLYHYVKTHSGVLNDANTAFVSLSLAIMSKIEVEREEARSFAKTFLDATGWRPAFVHHAAGALRYSQYDFFKKWIMRRISRAEGGPHDTTKDYEFTDWDAIDDFVDEAMEKAVPAVQDQAFVPPAL